MGVMITLVHPESGSPLAAILVAMMYSVGFVFVVLGRSELFTEHTTRAVYPVLMGRASTATLLRLWVTIFIANLIGITAFAKLTTVIGPALGVIEPGAFNHIAHSLVEHPVVGAGAQRHPGGLVNGTALLAGDGGARHH